MTDENRQMLSRLVTIYGFYNVTKELRRIAAGYARSKVEFKPVFALLKRLEYATALVYGKAKPLFEENV